jgi:lysine-specific demethylase 8
VAGLTAEEFERQYRAPGKPVVLTGKTDAWAARKGWTLASLRERFGQLPVNAVINQPEGVPYFHPDKGHRQPMTLATFLDMLEAGPALPCYVDQLVLSSLAGLEQELDLKALYPPEDWPTFTALWLGSANTRSGMHFDGNDNLYTQLIGSKRIFMAHPDEAARLYPFLEDFCKSQVEPEAPDLQRYPEFRKVILYQVDLQPGEVLFMPRVWWHHLRSLELSLSISHHFGETFRLGEHTRMLNLMGPRYWAEILRQFLINGMFGVKVPTRLYSQAPPGKLFFDYVKEMVTSSFNSRSAS